MNKLKRPDVSQWPEWLRDGPVRGNVWNNDEDTKRIATVVAYLPTMQHRYVYIADDEYYGSTMYAEPIPQWQPEPDEPVLWWWRRNPDSGWPCISAYGRVSAHKEGVRVCKPVIVSPWTIGECRRRLAAGELEELQP